MSGRPFLCRPLCVLTSTGLVAVRPESFLFPSSNEELALSTCRTPRPASSSSRLTFMALLLKSDSETPNSFHVVSWYSHRRTGGGQQV